MIRMTVFLLHTTNSSHVSFLHMLENCQVLFYRSPFCKPYRKGRKNIKRAFSDSRLQIAPIRNVRKMEERLPFVSSLPENYKVLFCHFGSFSKPCRKNRGYFSIAGSKLLQFERWKNDCPLFHFCLKIIKYFSVISPNRRERKG